MLVIKPKYSMNKSKKGILRQTIEPATEYGAPKPKRQRIDSLINGKGIIYQ